MNTNEQERVGDSIPMPTELVSLAVDGSFYTTSLVIAEGVGMAHKSVIQLIRQKIDLLNELGMVAFEMLPRLEGQHGGGESEIAILNYPQCSLLLALMRNTEVICNFKIRLVRKFYELAHAQAAMRPAPEALSRKAILRLALKAEEELEQKDEQIERDRPFVDFAQQVIDDGKSRRITDAAKVLGVKPHKLHKFMREIQWLTKEREPMQRMIDRGYLVSKIGSWPHPRLGKQTSESALITPKGMIKLQQLWTDHLLDDEG